MLKEQVIFTDFLGGGWGVAVILFSEFCRDSKYLGRPLAMLLSFVFPRLEAGAYIIFNHPQPGVNSRPVFKNVACPGPPTPSMKRENHPP